MTIVSRFIALIIECCFALRMVYWPAAFRLTLFASYELASIVAFLTCRRRWRPTVVEINVRGYAPHNDGPAKVMFAVFRHGDGLAFRATFGAETL